MRDDIMRTIRSRHNYSRQKNGVAFWRLLAHMLLHFIAFQPAFKSQASTSCRRGQQGWSLFEEYYASVALRNDHFDLSVCHICCSMDEIEAGEEWEDPWPLIGFIFFRRSPPFFSDRPTPFGSHCIKYFRDSYLRLCRGPNLRSLLLTSPVANLRGTRKEWFAAFDEFISGLFREAINDFAFSSVLYRKRMMRRVVITTNGFFPLSSLSRLRGVLRHNLLRYS